MVIKQWLLMELDRDIAYQKRALAATEKCAEPVLCWPKPVPAAFQLVPFAGTMGSGDPAVLV